MEQPNHEILLKLEEIRYNLTNAIQKSDTQILLDTAINYGLTACNENDSFFISSENFSQHNDFKHEDVIKILSEAVETGYFRKKFSAWGSNRVTVMLNSVAELVPTNYDIIFKRAS